MFINFVKKEDPLVKPIEGLKKWGLLYGVMKRVANSKIQKMTLLRERDLVCPVIYMACR